VKGTRSLGDGRSSADSGRRSSSKQQQPTGVRDEISWEYAPSPLLYRVESHTESELHCRLLHCTTHPPN
jgi:hypothetical protein